MASPYSETLRALLKKAGLPSNSPLDGKRFCFVHEGGEVHGRITGVELMHVEPAWRVLRLSIDTEWVGDTRVSHVVFRDPRYPDDKEKAYLAPVPGVRKSSPFRILGKFTLPAF